MKGITFGVAGIVLTAIGGLFVYNSRKEAKRQAPSRKLIISLIKKLHNEMFHVFLEIANCAQNYGSTIQIPPDQLRAVIMEDEKIMQKMKEVSSKVFVELSEQEFEYSITKDYENDNEIKYLLGQYQQEFEKSCLGVKPQIKQKNTVFLTKQKILSCVKELFSRKIQRLQKQDLRNKQENEIKRVLEEDARKDKVQRTKILKQLGLSKQPNKVFEFCVSKYNRMDANFKKEYEKLLQQYKTQIVKVIPS